MQYETLDLEIVLDGKIAFLMLERSDARNAINDVMVAELHHALEALAADPIVRVIVLYGHGRYFSIGTDVGWLQSLVSGSRDQRLDEARKMAALLHVLNNYPKPVIGWARGYVMGMAVGLLACCDVVMLEEGTRLRLSETHLGLVPSIVAPYLIARCGQRAFRRMGVTGAWVEADYAVLIGLAASVYPKNLLRGKVDYEAAEAIKSAPGAIAQTKAFANDLALFPGVDLVETTALQLADQLESDEARDGIAAAVAELAPPWAPAKR